MSTAEHASGAENVYRCNLGHEIRVNGTYAAMAVQSGDQYAEYNYCMHCLGAWAVRQWPLKLQAKAAGV